jgi:hypothetical protein
MKEKTTKSVIFILAFCVNFWTGCSRNDNEVKSITLVVPETFSGPVVIFFNQRESKGRQKNIKGKDFFYIDSSGVFFTLKKPGKDGMNLEGLSSELMTDIYSSSMSIEECSDESFKIVGGTYGGIKTKLYTYGDSILRFCVFKAGRAKYLKQGRWYVSNSVVEELYQKYMK